jgi:hypothetical protein
MNYSSLHPFVESDPAHGTRPRKYPLEGEHLNAKHERLICSYRRARGGAGLAVRLEHFGSPITATLQRVYSAKGPSHLSRPGKPSDGHHFRYKYIYIPLETIDD